MRNNNEFEIEREDEIFAIEKQASQQADGKKTKPHVIRRNVEDYLEKKALERRLKDIFDDTM